MKLKANKFFTKRTRKNLEIKIMTKMAKKKLYDKLLLNDEIEKK